MSYTRVTPRDLFNEAKLLKCLGIISLSILDKRPGTSNLSELIQNPEWGFKIRQDSSDGALFCVNYHIFFNGEKIKLYNPLNSREDLPLIFELNGVVDKVFSSDATFSSAFMKEVD